jgi:multiple sugar transport system substrate-binding protein
MKALSYAAGFNPNVLANGQDDAGNIYAVPISAYANSLQYNRALFTAAGLDPDKPPTTWEEVRADAKAIAEKTGKAGFTQMAKDATGGWMLTTLTYALGGRVESEDGKSATLDNPQTKQALQMLHDMRWVDKSMGTNAGYDWPTSNQDFAAGKIGMYLQGSDVYTFLRTQANIDPKVYGIATIPMAGDNAGVLGGGTLAAVKAGATDAEKAAAIKWIDYYYLSKLVNEADAVRDAKALAADKQPIGTPSLPIFDKSTWEKSQEWIKDYINVPTEQMKPFTSNIFNQKLVTEPAKSTQAVYQSLDPVVQAVLTDENANIDELLKTANTAAQRALDKG